MVHSSRLSGPTSSFRQSLQRNPSTLTILRTIQVCEFLLYICWLLPQRPTWLFMHFLILLFLIIIIIEILFLFKYVLFVSLVQLRYRVTHTYINAQPLFPLLVLFRRRNYHSSVIYLQILGLDCFSRSPSCLDNKSLYLH